MDTVFVGSDETGYYRAPNADEMRREVGRLEAENERLRAALEAMTASADRLLAERDQYIDRLALLLPTLNTAQVAALHRITMQEAAVRLGRAVEPAEVADLRAALTAERAERIFAQASWLHLVHKGHPDEADYPEPEPPA